MNDLTVVIINYRTADMVINCLKTLLPELIDVSCCIVIIDNASNDGSFENIRDWVSESGDTAIIKLVGSMSNGGFSSGNNLGIKERDSKYYLLLNSDTLIRPQSIQLLLKSASVNKYAGLITPRLEWPDGSPQESCFLFHSPLSELISSAQTGFITKLLSKYNVPLATIDGASKPDWSSFACVLIKKEVFNDVGFMDDGYFMYFEDAEFCHRARKAGWKVLNEPSAHVVHLRGGSSPVKENTKLRKRLPRYYYESRTRYFYQTHGWLGLTSANLLWIAGRIISKIRQMLGRSDKAVSEKQWLDIWINWLNPLKPYIHPDNYK